MNKKRKIDINNLKEYILKNKINSLQTIAKKYIINPSKRFYKLKIIWR